MAQRYDTLVLGGGMAGLPLALRAARHARVAFVEKEKLGGTCLNRGCIPTKTMIASAAVAQQVRRAAEFGVHTPGPVSVDLSAVVARKNGIVDPIRAGSYRTVDNADGIDFYHAAGIFTGPRRTASSTWTRTKSSWPPGYAPPTPPSPASKASRTTPPARCLMPPSCQPTCWWWAAATWAASSRRCSPASARESP